MPFQHSSKLHTSFQLFHSQEALNLPAKAGKERHWWRNFSG